MQPGPDLDTEWLRACRDRPLDSRDDRYIDLDGRGVRGRQSRKPILQDAIELAGDTPTCQLFTGYRGTGKSTDLARHEFNEVWREAIRADDVLLLDGIRTTRTPDHVTSGDMPRLARHLDSSLVLCHRNGGGWFDLHPAVRDHVRTSCWRDRPGSRPSSTSTRTWPAWSNPCCGSTSLPRRL